MQFYVAFNWFKSCAYRLDLLCFSIHFNECWQAAIVILLSIFIHIACTCTPRLCYTIHTHIVNQNRNRQSIVGLLGSCEIKCSCSRYFVVIGCFCGSFFCYFLIHISMFQINKRDSPYTVLYWFSSSCSPPTTRKLYQSSPKKKDKKRQQ